MGTLGADCVGAFGTTLGANCAGAFGTTLKTAGWIVGAGSGTVRAPCVLDDDMWPLLLLHFLSL